MFACRALQMTRIAGSAVGLLNAEVHAPLGLAAWYTILVLGIKPQADLGVPSRGTCVGHTHRAALVYGHAAGGSQKGLMSGAGEPREEAADPGREHAAAGQGVCGRGGARRQPDRHFRRRRRGAHTCTSPCTQGRASCWAPRGFGDYVGRATQSGAGRASSSALACTPHKNHECMLQAVTCKPELRALVFKTQGGLCLL